MSANDYWQECISNAADECGVVLTPEQLATLAAAVEIGRDNYGMAFYSPPASDRVSQIEREHEAKVAALEKAAEKYRHDAELAVKRALHQRDDAAVSIGENGSVTRWGGRVEEIQ